MSEKLLTVVLTFIQNTDFAALTLIWSLNKYGRYYKGDSSDDSKRPEFTGVLKNTM